MKIRNALLASSLLFAALSTNAQAANFFGKFDVAQSDGSSNNGTMRYYNASQQLSIYAAPGGYEGIVQQAFFRKAVINVSYTPIVCPAGIGGSCGKLTWVSVSALNLP